MLQCVMRCYAAIMRVDVLYVMCEDVFGVLMCDVRCVLVCVA